jgi:hypothetical protein
MPIAVTAGNLLATGKIFGNMTPKGIIGCTDFEERFSLLQKVRKHRSAYHDGY